MRTVKGRTREADFLCDVNFCNKGDEMMAKKNTEKRYRREDIVCATCFSAAERDFLQAILPDEEYSLIEVRNLIRRELERVVE